MPRVVGARGNRAATRARTRERVAARGESPRATIARAIRARRRAETRRASRRAAVRASPSAAPRNVVVRARCDGFDFARRRRRRKRARGDARERASERAGRGERARTCRVRRQPKGLRVRVCVCVERDGACAQLSRLEERFAPPAAKSTAQDAFRQSFPADRRLARRGRISGLVRGTSVRYSVLRRVYSPLTPKSRSNENRNGQRTKKIRSRKWFGQKLRKHRSSSQFRPEKSSPRPVPCRVRPERAGAPAETLPLANARGAAARARRATPRRRRRRRRRRQPSGRIAKDGFVFHLSPSAADGDAAGTWRFASPRAPPRRPRARVARRRDGRTRDEETFKLSKRPGSPRELSSRPRDLGPVGGVGAAAAAARVIAVAAAAAAARPSVRRRRRRPRAPTASASHEPRPRAFLRRLQRVHHEQKEARA